MLSILSMTLAAALNGTPVMTQATQATRLTTPTGVLHGTLELPSKPSQMPVVLLLSGSGPTDRDGNSAGFPGRNDGLKLLAQALAERGIASVRYDKRGIGQSAPAAVSVASDPAAAFRAEVNDAARWISQLKRDARFSTVTVIGHSQGALTGMLALRTSPADRFVSLAGTADNVYDVLLRQLRPQVPPDLLQDVQGLLNDVRDGLERTTLPDSITAHPALATVFAPPLLPYLTEWIRHDPAQVLKSLSLPSLIVVGGVDDRAGPNDLTRLAGIRANVQGALIEGMSHPLKQAVLTPQSQLEAYTDPAVPLADGLVDLISTFITAP